MTDFEPVTDVPDRIDQDDRPVASTAHTRDAAVQTRRRRVLVTVVIVLAGAAFARGFDPWRVAVAAAIMYFIFRSGFAMIGAFARPVPEPPPPGELRRVKFKYRCGQCGTELRMTLSNDQVPEAPRHCTDEMDLIATEDDAL